MTSAPASPAPSSTSAWTSTRRGPAPALARCRPVVDEALADCDAGKVLSIPSKRYKVITGVSRHLPTRVMQRFQALGRRCPGSVDGVAQDRAGHATAAAAPPAELAGGDGDDLDACLAQQGVGVGVAVVADDDAGLERDRRCCRRPTARASRRSGRPRW